MLVFGGVIKTHFQLCCCSNAAHLFWMNFFSPTPYRLATPGGDRWAAAVEVRGSGGETGVYPPGDLFFWNFWVGKIRDAGILLMVQKSGKINHLGWC